MGGLGITGPSAETVTVRLASNPSKTRTARIFFIANLLKRVWLMAMDNHSLNDGLMV
jgi:hypothetical protein